MYTSYTYIQFQKIRLELVSKRCCPFDPPSKSPTSFNTTQMGASHASSSMENHVASFVVKSQLWKTPQHQAIRTFPKPGKLGDDDSESSRWKFPELPMESLFFPQEWGLEPAISFCLMMFIAKSLDFVLSCATLSGIHLDHLWSLALQNYPLLPNCDMPAPCYALNPSKMDQSFARSSHRLTTNYKIKSL